MRKLKPSSPAPAGAPSPASPSGVYWPEDVFQAACFMWARNNYPATSKLLWHTPNGGSRNKIEGAKLKALGVVAGVFDFLFFWGGRLYAFELKVGSNEMSDKQIEWGHRLTAQGAICFEVRTLARFMELFTWAYNGGKGAPPPVQIK